jgi:hypothetical protein
LIFLRKSENHDERIICPFSAGIYIPAVCIIKTGEILNDQWLTGPFAMNDLPLTIHYEL